MRPNNQIKRSRGRNNNGGRKHTNPLSRNYESNGPNVKIRGNAAHIAEKYVQLARDAQTSGDSVMAENFLQHAEHYFRIISAAQAQNPQRNDQPNQNQNDDNDSDGDGDDDGNDDAGQSNAPSGDSRFDSRSTNQSSDRDEVDTTASEREEPKRERAQRERRPRRKPRAAEGGEDPSSAPQPDVSSLPAFLTGGQTDAAE